MELQALEDAMLQAAIKQSIEDNPLQAAMSSAMSSAMPSALSSAMDSQLSELGSLSSMLGNLLESAGGNQNSDGAPSSSSVEVRDRMRDYTIQTTITGMSDEDIAALVPKRDFIIEERARALATQAKFYEAASILEELDDLNDTSFGMKLLIAECYLQLGRENKATKAVDGIRKFILTSSLIDVNEIMELAEAMKKDKGYVRALILFKIASDVANEDSSSSPDEKVENIFRAVARMQKTVTDMIEPEDSNSKLQELLLNISGPSKGPVGSTNQKQSVGGDRKRILALDFGVEYMHEMLNDLRSVEKADMERQTLKEAWCTNYIGYDLAALGENAKSGKIRMGGIAAMDKTFGPHASSHKIYGILLHNVGIVLHNQEKYKEAEKIYVQAIEAKENALDHDSEKEKQHDVDLVRTALKVTRQHLK